LRHLAPPPLYPTVSGLTRRAGRSSSPPCKGESSRRGTDLTRSFPDLAAAALEQLPVETIVDGAAVVGVKGRPEFAEL
jgi:hypothetical protein